jgi:hypothetical protein
MLLNKFIRNAVEQIYLETFTFPATFLFPTILILRIKKYFPNETSTSTGRHNPAAGHDAEAYTYYQAELTLIVGYPGFSLHCSLCVFAFPSS